MVAHCCCSARKDQVQSLGKWNRTAMDISYLTGMDTDTLTIAAGHAKGCFDLPRGRVDPPKELVSLVFPWLEDAKQVVAKVSWLWQWNNSARSCLTSKYRVSTHVSTHVSTPLLLCCSGTRAARRRTGTCQHRTC